MKLTKFTQSCLKIENDGQALLFDVGTLTTPNFDMKDFGDIDAVVFTHSHFDHFDVDFLPQLVQAGATIYGNVDVAEKAGGCKVEVIEDGEELVIAGFKVKAINIEHCLMLNGEPAGIPNTAFLLNDDLLIPGDSLESGGITAKTVALPIFGPDMSYQDAYKAATNWGASKVIPVHHDVANIDPSSFVKLAKLGGNQPPFEIVVVQNGASIDL